MRAVLSRMQRARKREHLVDVRFATGPADVRTREGLVRASAGDAIVTGVQGEQWPVSPAAFAARYVPVSPCDGGGDGSYRTRPIDVRAARMTVAFTVEDPQTGFELEGRPGSWLVDYGRAEFAVVDGAIFEATYELLGAD